MKPVSYLQTDSKWSNISYSAPGEYTTIGRSGCGPTAMAMVLATWANPAVTPATECAWALRNGYKAPHSGTYYGYFEPAGKRYGLTVKRLNYANIYGFNSSPAHDQAKEAVDRGDLVIACMGKGNWTRSGHYVLVWAISGNTIYINDPASTRPARTRGDYSLFKKQVKYYWTIKNPNPDKPKKEEEEEDMDISKLTPEDCYKIAEKAMEYYATLPEPDWSKEQGHWAKATSAGIVDGSAPERPVKRCELMTIIDRIGTKND